MTQDIHQKKMKALITHTHTHTHIHIPLYSLQGFPVGSVVKNLPASAGDPGLLTGSRRSPGEK